jgi:hypothetical protein
LCFFLWFSDISLSVRVRLISVDPHRSVKISKLPHCTTAGPQSTFLLRK